MGSKDEDKIEAFLAIEPCEEKSKILEREREREQREAPSKSTFIQD